MYKIEELKEKLCCELEEYAKDNNLDEHKLEIIDTLAHTIKNLDKIIGRDEYSGRSYGYDGRSYDYAMSNNGWNYSRARGNSARRDSMGRYSGHDMVGNIKTLMENAPDEQTRSELGRIMQRYE